MEVFSSSLCDTILATYRRPKHHRGLGEILSNALMVSRDNSALWPALSAGVCMFRKSLLRLVTVDLHGMKPT